MNEYPSNWTDCYRFHSRSILIILHPPTRGGNVCSSFQNVTTPENRGTAFALFTLSDDIGKGEIITYSKSTVPSLTVPCKQTRRTTLIFHLILLF